MERSLEMSIPEGEAYVHALEATIAALQESRRSGQPPARGISRIVDLACARHAKRTAERALGDAVKAFETPAQPHQAASTNIVAANIFPSVFEWVTRRQVRTMLANALKNGFQGKTIIDVATSTKHDVGELPNLGRRGLRELEDLLAEHGLHLGMSREGAEAVYVPTPDMSDPKP